MKANEEQWRLIKSWWLQSIPYLYGGPEVDRRRCGMYVGAARDIKRAKELAAAYTTDESLWEVILNTSQERARIEVENHWQEIEALAKVLRKTNAARLSGDEVREIVRLAAR